jgi:hypothetical protein
MNDSPSAKPEPSAKERLSNLGFADRLYSTEYPCPGGHFSRKLTYQELDGSEGHYRWMDDGLIYYEGQLPPGVKGIPEGECPEVITIILETETDDMGGSMYSYPVADGPCVEALGWEDDDSWYSSSVLGRYSERQKLRSKFSEAADLIAAGDNLAKVIGTTTFTSMPSNVEAALERYRIHKQRFNSGVK